MAEDYKLRSGWVAGFACAALGAVHGTLLYGSAGRDDSHITYWAAQVLAQTGSILNINGEAVEQSSSLLHVLLLALCFWLTDVSLPTLGVLFSAAAGVVASLFAWMGARWMGLPFPAFVPLYLAIFPYGVYWSFGGLETSLLALTTLLAIGCIVRVLSAPLSHTSGVLILFSFAALVMVRPESVFVITSALSAVAVLLVIARHDKPFVLKLALLLGVLALTFGALCVFRFFVFEQIFPQPVYAKSAGLTRIGAGLAYLKYGYLRMVSLDLLTVFAVVALVTALFPKTTRLGLARPSARMRTALIVLASFVAAQLAFVVASGGDWMEGGRFLVPVLAPLALSGFFGISLLPKRAAIVAIAVIALSAVVDLYRFQSESKGTPIWHTAVYSSPVLADFEVQEGRFSWFELSNRVHLRDVPMVIALGDVVRQLRVQGVHPVTIHSMQMGMVPFHLAAEFPGAIRFVDIASLVTRDFTDCPVTAGTRRTAFGAVVFYREFFKSEAAIRELCNIKRPEVIFDLGPSLWGDPRSQVERNGYRIVFSVSGNLPGESLGQVSGLQFIGVRKDLAEGITLSRPDYVWPEQHQVEVAVPKVSAE